MRISVRKYFSLALFVTLLINWTQAHSNGEKDQSENTYRIMHGDDQIGVLKAQKQQNTTGTTYRILTNVKASLLKEFHITYNLSVQFDTGKMVKAFLKTAVNQRTWDSTHVQWQDNKYRIDKDGEAAYFMEKPPCTYSTACMYFQKPPSKQVFSEQYTQKVQVKEVKSNIYKLNLPSGNANYYHYDQQGLAKVVVNDTPVTIRFIRV